MSFEIKSVEYDPARKLNTVGQNRKISANGNVMSTQYNPVPYNFNIELSILSRNADDACRIVEQIVPFFKPDWTTSINLIPEMSIVMDIPIILRSINYQDTYDGSFTDRYAIVWDLQFVLKGFLFGPITNQGPIKEVDINYYVPTINVTPNEDAFDALPSQTDDTSFGIGVIPAAEGVVITPGMLANGSPTSNASLTVPSSQIFANSTYGFITDFFSNIDKLS
jgi:hypothetical protein